MSCGEYHVISIHDLAELFCWILCESQCKVVSNWAVHLVYRWPFKLKFAVHSMGSTCTGKIWLGCLSFACLMLLGCLSWCDCLKGLEGESCKESLPRPESVCFLSKIVSIWSYIFVLHMAPMECGVSRNSWSELSECVLLSFVAVSIEGRRSYNVDALFCVGTLSSVVMSPCVATAWILIFESGKLINEVLKMSLMITDKHPWTAFEISLKIVLKASAPSFTSIWHTVTQCIVTSTLLQTFVIFVLNFDLPKKISNVLSQKDLNMVQKFIIFKNVWSMDLLLCRQPG